jgi:hypothetical protein
MSTCNECPQIDECAERRACQRRQGAIVWPLYPKGMDPKEARDAAEAINAYNARVHAAVDALLIRTARWALALIGGPLLGLWTIATVWGGS